VITTVLRSGVHEVRDGVRLLRPNPDIPYRDGAEERLWEIVGSATDISSDSTEMLEVAEGWAQQYHVHPARANILRSLEIPASARVLEIGSGCGPITRYLGETGALVDSVEPVLPRARVGAARTRDLTNVEVFCGNLEDVPSEATYDLVVVVGVLEYVGDGGRDHGPYLQFLRECRTRLSPGGSLVLAIENKLGVKYLTGTGEDHSGRLFDSVEDYPRGTRARTFSASALLGMVSSSDFHPQLYGVFPDYKHTRVVFDIERLQAAAPDLLENLPSFPSRFAGTRSLRLASEARVWKELVRDGIAAHFTNSFLVIGSTEAPSALWPSDRLAKYFSINRRREYVAETTISQLDHGLRLDRRYSPEPGPLITAGVTSWEYVPGQSFLEAYVNGDEKVRRDLLRRWLDLVESSTDGDTLALDAIPTNVIVTEDGTLKLIDSEFHDIGSIERVIRRGLFWMAVHVARNTPPEMWSPARTIGDLMHQIAALAAVEVNVRDVDGLLEQEAGFQVTVSTHYLGPDARAGAEGHLRGIFDCDIWDVPLGRRLHHVYDSAIAAQETLKTHYDAAITQRDQLRTKRAQDLALQKRLQGRYDKVIASQERLKKRMRSEKHRAVRAEQTLADVTGSRTFRLADGARRALRRIRPRL
jgi:SAM-dependent methyltransferase